MMKRLMVSLPVPAYQWLTEESKRLGISTAELLRRLIDEKRGAQR